MVSVQEVTGDSSRNADFDQSRDVTPSEPWTLSRAVRTARLSLEALSPMNDESLPATIQKLTAQADSKISFGIHCSYHICCC